MNLNIKDCFDIFINSDDRTNTNGSNSNFTVNLNNRNQIGRAGYIMVKNAEIPIGSVYQIKTTDVFAFSIDGTSTISFDFTGYEGTYTVTSLTNLLKTQMESLDLVSNVYTFTYDSDNNKISFSATFSSGVAEIRGSLCSDNIQKILGTGSNTLTLTTSGTSLEFQNQCDFYTNYRYYLTCSLINSNNVGSSYTPANSILTIFQSQRFTRSYIVPNLVEPNLYYCSSLMNQLNISILDEFGRDIYIPPNLNISLTLRFFPI